MKRKLRDLLSFLGVVSLMGLIAGCEPQPLEDPDVWEEQPPAEEFEEPDPEEFDLPEEGY